MANPEKYEKQKVFQLVMDTSVAAASQERPSHAIKETSFESINCLDNLFVTGDDRSSLAENWLSRKASERPETDSSQVTVMTAEDKDASFIEQQLSKINKNLSTFTLE